MRGFIDRVVDGVSVILLEGGGRAYVPISSLPVGSDAGSLVEVTMTKTDIAPGVESAEELAALIERLRAGEHRHG
ncbi:MAG: hypothetical protein ACT4P5_10135 [Armatimonadota bacterium]